MTWHILICAALLTVNLFGQGQTSGEEPSLPMEKVREAIKESKINIPGNGKSKSVIHLSDLGDTLNTHGPQADHAHFRYVRATDINNNDILKLINNTLHQILNSEDITKMENTTEIIYLVLEKIISYYEKNAQGGIPKMLGGLLCTINQIDITNLTAKTIMDIINSLDKTTTCSEQQQKVILEKFVQMFSISQWFSPEYIFRFLTSDKFQMYAKTIGIPDGEMAKIAGAVAFIEKTKIVDWTMSDFGERFLCHLSTTNFTQIDEQVLANTLPKLINKPECTQNLLKTKWTHLATSFTHAIKGLILPQVEEVGKEINKWPVEIMEAMKMVNWTEVRKEILEAAYMLNGIADKIITNVKSSSDKNMTLKGLVQNFVCGLNITDFSKLDEKFPERILNTFGKLDVCNEKQQEKAWETYLHASAKMNSIQLIDGLNKIIGNISISDILANVKDEQIQAIRTIMRSTTKSKGLDTLIGTLWHNLKNNSNQLLNMDYILSFMACNVNISEITNMDVDKLMNIVAKFGQPVTCTIQNPTDWLADFMLKLQSVMYSQQLDKLDEYFGGFHTRDLKHIAMKVEKLKNLAMASLVKVAKKSDEWISYMEQNGSVFNISTIVRHLVCFIAKGNFSSIETVIISLGEFGQCTESESIKLTETILNSFNKLNESETIKELLIGLGILSGKFNVKKMQDFITKLIKIANNYLLNIWDVIPKKIKELSIAKVLKMIGNEMAKIDEIVMCIVKAVTWPIFGQPDAPDFRDCFYKKTSEKPEPKPGKSRGGKLEDRYKVGADFPFMKMLETKANSEMLLQRLLKFTKEPNTEKEGRILDFVTKKVIDYLLATPKRLNEILSDNKKRILELATKVNRGAQILSKTKVDSESLSMVKKIATPQQARKLLKKALNDMKIETKSVTEKKNFIKKISSDVLMKSGTELVDKFYSEATKNVFIQIFMLKKEPKTSEERMEDEEETESLTKLNLVHKLMDKTSDNETLGLIMNTSLVTVISVTMLKTLPHKEMCSMKAETTELKDDQIQYLINSCPKEVENIAKTNPTHLGKIATKVTKGIVNNLILNELVSLTSEACRYESKLDIELEKVFKEHYITQKLDPMKNGTSMFCVLKHVHIELQLQQPQAIKLCKTLGNSMIKKIPPKQAEFFKSKCMDLLKKRNITFADMGSMNAFLKKADIQNLEPEIILQGAEVLGGYIWNLSVFNAIGKTLSDLTSFKQRSRLTTDQVAQAGIFFAAWSDADTIPKESVLETFDSIATSVGVLQKKKLQCLKEGQDNSKCNVMDDIIARIVQILIKATTSRLKRSTTASCHCSNIVSLGVAAVQVPASQMSEMICVSNFDECMEGLSQINDWNQDHRKVFVQKALKIWSQPVNWNSSHMAIASAVIPGLSTDQIKTLPLDSMDATFYLGKQNNWGLKELREIFILFLKNLKNNNISSITSFDLQALGNIVCGISTDNIHLIPKWSYINAASQIGSLKICLQDQLTAWAEKALAVYGNDVNKWGLAEIASIGSVISGFSTLNLQKLNEKQIAAISLKTIPKILPEKLANLHPVQIGYLTTSQVQMVTSAQKAQMTEEQRNILNKKFLGSVITDQGNSGGQTIEGSCYFKWSILLIIFANFVNPSVWFLN